MNGRDEDRLYLLGPVHIEDPQGHSCLSPALPAVHLNLKEMSSRDVAEGVFDESIEIGLMRPMPLPEGLLATELFREPLVAVINASPLAEASGQTAHGGAGP